MSTQKLGDFLTVHLNCFCYTPVRVSQSLSPRMQQEVQSTGINYHEQISLDESRDLGGTNPVPLSHLVATSP